MMDFMDKTIARTMARRVCSVIREDGKRILCVEVLTRILVYGDSVKEEVRSVMEREFTEEERRKIRERLAEIMG
jgi:uncharacterized protein YaaR (DUF327 family)